jgi:hypothetical protein
MEKMSDFFTLILILLSILLYSPIFADEYGNEYPQDKSLLLNTTLPVNNLSENKDSPGQQKPGNKFGFEFGMGIQGSLSFFQIGVLFPKINNRLFLDVKARICSSVTWATFIDMETNEAVSFHPVVAGGIISFGGCSPFIYDCIRMYGGMDLLLGYSFTPYDSVIYEVDNLIGDNLTFAILGYFGLELFTAPKMAFYLDGGGGYKSLFGDKENIYVIASSWLGSGFGFKMGMRFFL